MGTMFVWGFRFVPFRLGALCICFWSLVGLGWVGWSSAGLMGMVVFTSLVVGSLGGIVFGTCYHNLGHTVGWCFASSSVLSADIN